MLFLAEISHELRTPLTVMRGEAEVMMRSRAPSTADWKETLRTIVEQAKDMTGLIDDLLFLTRAEADAIRFDIETVSLHDVIEEVLSDGRVIAAFERRQPTRRSAGRARWSSGAIGSA